MRRRLLLDLVVLVALAGALYQLRSWREAALEAYGLDLYRLDGKATRLLGKVPAIALTGEDAGAYEWRGHIVAPRCGRYRFFAFGAGELVLQLDGRELEAAIPPAGSAACFAVHEGWIAAGSHRLRVRYRSWTGRPARLRLMWSPGRNDGAAEPMATSLLAGEADRGAGERRRARPYALAPRDSLAGALALGALALAFFVWWRRPLAALLVLVRREAWARHDVLLAAAIFIFALILRLWGGDGAEGLPGEETLLAAARGSVGALFAGDLSPLSWHWSRGTSSGAALLYAPAALFNDALAAGRVLSALFGALGAALLFVAGRELIGRGVALLAGLIFAVLPPLVAAGREVSVESVTALCFLLTLWLFWRGCRLWREVIEGEAERAVSARRAFWGAGWALGATAALQLSVAFSAMAVMLVIFATIFGRRLWKRGALRFPAALLALPASALLAALLLEPGLWARPLAGLAEQILAATGEGQPLAFLEAPSWLVSQAPPWLWALALLGALRALGLLFSRTETPAAVRRRRVGGALAILWLLTPLAVAAVAGRSGASALAVSQLVMPALLALCLLAALGIEAITRLVAHLMRRDELRPALLGLAGGAMLLALFVGVVRFHPHLAAYDAGWGGGQVQRSRQQRAAHGALAEAVGYVARAAQGGESVALDFDAAERVGGCAVGPKGRALRLRAEVTLVPWGERVQSASWLISAMMRHAPTGYRLAKALRAGDVVLLRIFRRSGAEE